MGISRKKDSIPEYFKNIKFWNSDALINVFTRFVDDEDIVSKVKRKMSSVVSFYTCEYLHELIDFYNFDNNLKKGLIFVGKI